jgi:hypothetical protein
MTRISAQTGVGSGRMTISARTGVGSDDITPISARTRTGAGL